MRMTANFQLRATYQWTIIIPLPPNWRILGLDGRARQLNLFWVNTHHRWLQLMNGIEAKRHICSPWPEIELCISELSLSLPQ